RRNEQVCAQRRTQLGSRGRGPEMRNYVTGPLADARGSEEFVRYRAAPCYRAATARERFSRGLISLPAICLLFSVCLSAAEIGGKLVDPSGAAIPNAEVSIVTRVGVEAQTLTARDGAFLLPLSETAEAADARVVATAPGFQTKKLSP